MTDSIASSQGATDAAEDEEEETTTPTCHSASDENGLSESPTGLPYVLKKPHANSKLILQNMEEVLNSVKKKHRQKHRRKREQRKLAQMEAEAAQLANGSADKEDTHDKRRRQRQRKSLQAQIDVQENGMSPKQKQKRAHGAHAERKSPLKGVSVSANNTILKHFTRTPTKADAKQPNDETSCEAVAPAKSTKPTNVFELMMNARNRSIGSNTPGKDAPPVVIPDELDESAATKVNRKLMLQQWAERKGGAKRRLDEEQRAEYVDQQLKQRSKRFKRMLVNGSCPSGAADAAKAAHESTKPQETAAVSAVNVVRVSTRRVRMPRGRTSRRLSSTESLELSSSTPPPAVDAEAAEFLAKLSSPTKKRDSLLGYFPKKPSPQQLAGATTHQPMAAKEREYTPKTRGRRANVNKNASAATTPHTETPTNGVVAAAAQPHHTPSGRPRRSCAGKTRSYADCEGLPGGPPNATKAPSRCRSNSDSDLEIINLDDSNTDEVAARTPKKLAPLFTRSLPRPSLDPELLKARQEFLMSGVPDKIRLEKAKRQRIEQTYDEAFEWFPRLSHVQQWTSDDIALLQRTSLSGTHAFKLRDTEPQATNGSVDVGDAGGRRSKTRTRCTLSSITTCTPQDFRACASTAEGLLANKAAWLLAHFTPLPPLDNKCAVIKTWKLAFEIFPTYKCFNQMREKYRYFSAIDAGQATQQVSESLVVTRRTRRSAEAQRRLDPDAAEAQPPMAAPNGELLFTEKYRPMMLEQVLVNLNPVTRLREFLSAWSHGGGGEGRNSQCLDDSMDCANDSNSSQMAACNTVVLLGACASGKTNAVFALANEMNFNVLEINAGMRRTGKKLIQELHEATQSHQIAKEPTAAGQTQAQKNLLKMSLHGAKARKKATAASSQSQSQSQSLDDSDASSELNQSARKCLILIEDADIVFEQHDAGFTDAIYTLAASSKRPVIVVATNPNCAHLQRLMNQNTITFSAPNTVNISRFMSVLALMENCPIRLEDVISLYLYNGKDVRKTLLELQFFIQSGGDLSRCGSPKQLQRTPTKAPQQQQQPQPPQSPRFFASPSKRRFSQEQQPQSHTSATATAAAVDEQLQSTRSAHERSELKMHSTLFEFYSTSQNQLWRVPFPLDLRLLAANLGDMFKAASTLQAVDEHGTEAANETTATAAPTKRRTRSPQKSWLTDPLDCLASFYENVSVAALLCACDSSLEHAPMRDRLVAYPAEHMAHELVERSIDVHLAEPACDYNLFYTPDERAEPLSTYLSGNSQRSQRTNALDYEPTLRAICRSERVRATQERRSTRFYHYLRNSVNAHMGNFSTKPFDAACEILQ